MYLHALHTVHALPGLRIAGGRLGDGLSRKILITSEMLSVIDKGLSLRQKKLVSVPVRRLNKNYGRYPRQVSLLSHIYFRRSGRSSL